jgi:hypothetical protein
MASQGQSSGLIGRPGSLNGPINSMKRKADERAMRWSIGSKLSERSKCADMWPGRNSGCVDSVFNNKEKFHDTPGAYCEDDDSH